MIFVTVGTHEQPFDRLLKYVDELIEQEIIKEEVIVQKGYSNYEPKYYNAEKLFPYDQMQEYIKDARIVITHGGPASFISPLVINKIPIVVPRKKEFNEHVNDHQLEFAEQVEKRMKNIIVVRNEEEFKDAIINYEDRIKLLNSDLNSNNRNFNKKLKNEIKNIFGW